MIVFAAFKKKLWSVSEYAQRRGSEARHFRRVSYSRLL